MMGTSILIGLAILGFVAVVVIYNGLVNKNQMVKNGWADIDVQLKPVARLVAVAEAYPELKSDQNFLDLQNELSDTENKIEMARRFFNGAVREMNTRVQSFPANLVASAFGFREKDFFEIQTADRALPSVDFKGE